MSGPSIKTAFASSILQLKERSGTAWDREIRQAERRHDAAVVEEAQRDRDDCLDHYDHALKALSWADLGAVRAALYEAAIREQHHGHEPLARRALKALPLAS